MGVDHLSPSTPLDNQARAKTRLRAFAKTRLCVFVPRESPRRAWLCSFSRRRSLSNTQGRGRSGKLHVSYVSNVTALQAPWYSASLDARVCEAARWLQAAFHGGHTFAHLYLVCFPAYDAWEHNTALLHLKRHLSWHVERGRGTCAGCAQTRGEDTPMLTCSGCRVARVCSADHQKMASKKATVGGDCFAERHKDICAVLGKWRQVVKGGVSPDSCTADLMTSSSDECTSTHPAGACRVFRPLDLVLRGRRHRLHDDDEPLTPRGGGGERRRRSQLPPKC